MLAIRDKNFVWLYYDMAWMMQVFQLVKSSQRTFKFLPFLLTLFWLQLEEVYHVLQSVSVHLFWFWKIQDCLFLLEVHRLAFAFTRSKDLLEIGFRPAILI
jgi:hypothetical protein